jgi:anti-sigma factor (TIGR02949 family)
MNCNDAQAMMHAYLDGELGPSVSFQFQQHFGDCPACSKAMAEHQAIQAAMKSDSHYFKAPETVRDRLYASLKKQCGPPASSWSLRFPRIWVAAAACFVGCVGLGFLMARFMFPPSVPERLSQEVASAHIRSLQVPKRIVDVPSSDSHVVKPWFNGKLDFAPPTPDLKKLGFPLVGGRLDYLNGRPVAALVYGRREHIINLFVWPEGGTESSELQQVARQGYNLIHWSSAGMNHWLVSDLNAAELHELAQLLRE